MQQTQHPIATPPTPAGRFLGETAEALTTMALFVLLALAGVALERWAGGPAPAYPSGMASDSSRGALESSPSAPSVWLVDGFNVLHTAVLRGAEREGWWSEAGRTRLLERLRGFREPHAELWVVFDGGRPSALAAGAPGPQVVFAPSADDWLLARVRSAAHPETLVVVTADRKLGDRVRHAGARVVSPRELLMRCGGGPPEPPSEQDAV